MEEPKQIKRLVGQFRIHRLQTSLFFVCSPLEYCSVCSAKDAMLGNLLDQILDVILADLFNQLAFVAHQLSVNEAIQCKTKVVLQNQPNNAQRRTAQGKRVFRSGGLLINRPEPGQRVDLVGQRHGHRHWCCRHIIRRPERRVMLLASRGDLRGQTGGVCIVAPHQPLQFWEFVDHFRRQIGLGHLGRLLCQISVGTHHWGQFPRQCRNPVDPRLLRSQLIVERHILQRVQPRGHLVPLGDTQIVFPEKLRVRQARRQHLLVTRKDRGTMIRRFAVGHGDKPLNAPGLRVLHRKELLMLFHGSLQNLRR